MDSLDQADMLSKARELEFRYGDSLNQSSMLIEELLSKDPAYLFSIFEKLRILRINNLKTVRLEKKLRQIANL